MIKIFNYQLNNETISSINKLIEFNLKPVPAFKLMRIIKDLSSLIEDKLSVERKIVEKWIERDVNGLPITVIEDGQIISGAVKIKNIKEFQEEMDSLLNIEILLNHNKIKIEELGLSEIKIKDLLKIDFLFE